jgi:hypothetical protein
MRSLTISGLALLGVLSWCATATEAKQPSALELAGLSSMTQMTDSQGEAVRGQGYLAGTSGMSFITGMLIDPVSASHIQGTSVQYSGSVEEGESWTNFTNVVSSQTSHLGLEMTVESNNTLFSGSLGGIAGGLGFAGFAGFSFDFND